MTDYRDILVRLHTANLLAWEDMPADTAREVREALDDEPAPAPAPTPSAHQCPNCGAGSPEVCGGMSEWWLECGRCGHTSRNYYTEEDAVAGGFRRGSDSTPSSAPTDSGAEPAHIAALDRRDKLESVAQAARGVYADIERSVMLGRSNVSIITLGGYLRALDSTPSPTPSVDSGAEPARGEGASARACWDCAHDSIGDGRGMCLRQRGPTYTVEVSNWITHNYDREPKPWACNCPGWAPREAGEAPHE